MLIAYSCILERGKTAVSSIKMTAARTRLSRVQLLINVRGGVILGAVREDYSILAVQYHTGLSCWRRSRLLQVRRWDWSRCGRLSTPHLRGLRTSRQLDRRHTGQSGRSVVWQRLVSALLLQGRMGKTVRQQLLVKQSSGDTERVERRFYRLGAWS